ncbi:DNA polymerase Y family protein [Mesorhizobium sp. RP14(2022)]|uniref:DNA polymerase Y family protein n=1 Tax=Mesorhizobium liriopis TaxID=2953882 RepID=A0ABT1C8H9_9HYPH|nr:DNA polymerase Y family protein [Mesorhizobium liriopis]MCO6050271.1 DNA polymerase Y family protein [Mesorhizobium liriopis]
MRKVISVFLPTWATDRLSRRLGTAAPTRETPVVLAGREGNRRAVLAVNDSARRLGIWPGMAATQAQALLPDLATFEAEPDEDAAHLARLAAWALKRYSPVVAADAPDGLAIDATGATHLHGGEYPMLNDIVLRLGQAGIEAKAAMASTYGAAHALARTMPMQINVHDFPSEKRALGLAPVRALRLPAETVLGLKVMGLERVRDLLARPRAPLVHRFGTELSRRLDQATGHIAEPITPVVVPDLISVTRGFPEPISAPETLQRYTGLLVDDLCVRLEKGGMGARKLDLLFHRIDARVEAIRIGTAKPGREPKHLSRLLLSRLETVDPGFGVERMTLTALVAEPLDYKPTGTLGEKARADVTTLVDTLASRVGAERLYRMALVESDLPERSVRRVAPLSNPTSLRWPENWPRPSRLFSPPEPITTVALLPDHPPATFTWRNTRHRVIRADGPERMHGEWIRSDAEMLGTRDYFHVEDEAGLRFWLFRKSESVHPDTGPHHWFMHGLFA